MSDDGKFCTVVSCMDGRIQLSVNTYLREHFGVDYVDTVTEAGPNGILARQDSTTVCDAIFSRIDISVHQHGSAGIAVVGHHDCAGNPGERDHQDADTRAAVALIRDHYAPLPVIGLWVNDAWEVSLLAVAVGDPT